MPVDFLTDAQLARYGRYADEPSPIQLARYFYLDDADRSLIAKRRGDHSRLGFALQICTARFLGTFLTDPTDVPPGVVAHLASQLKIPDTACLAKYRVGKTHWEHASDIRAAFGHQTFADQPGHFHFLRWLYARAWLGIERPSILFDRATAWLVARKVLLPGASVLERHIAQVREQANSRMWRLLARMVNEEQRTQLEGLLLIADGERVSLLEQLRRPPTLQSGNGLLQGLERIGAVRALAIERLTISHIPPSRVQSLARFAMTARTQAIDRMPDERKTATLLAFVQLLEATAHDDVLDIFDTFFTTVFADARLAGIKERVRTLKDLDAAALQLATIGAMVLDPTLTGGELRAAVLTIFTPDEITSALEQVADLAHPPDDTYYDELEARYRRVSRIRPTLLRTMHFGALPAGQAILDAYAFLQQIEPKARPSMQQAPRKVINRLWQRYAITALNTVDRMAYTYCVFDRLKDALRRRELFVTPSVRYADPRLGLLEGAAWEAARPQVCRMLGRTTNVADELATLAKRLDEVYRSTAETLQDNAAVQIETIDGKAELKLSPLEKLEEPTSLRTLRTKMGQLVPQADLPEVLLEIHRRTGFADEFTHISEAEARADDLHISICAVLLAEACNIGLSPLVNPNVRALTRDRLAWVQQN